MNGYPDRICYHYDQEEGMRLRPAHGVWGGINPHGELEICFYEESDMPPKTSEMLIGPDGTPGAEQVAMQDDARHISRHIHTRLLLNYDTARAVADWLEERLGELESDGQGPVFDLNSGPQQ